MTEGVVSRVEAAKHLVLLNPLPKIRHAGSGVLAFLAIWASVLLLMGRLVVVFEKAK